MKAASPVSRRLLALSKGIYVTIQLGGLSMLLALCFTSVVRLHEHVWIHDRGRAAIVQTPHPRTALVTMSSSQYLNCARQLIQSARDNGWRQPIFLLIVDVPHLNETSAPWFYGLGVHIHHTTATLDAWVNLDLPRRFNYRRLNPVKFRKLEILFNPVFRSFERIIYMDPDGIVASSLDPLVTMSFPKNLSIIMRQNDVSMGKPSFWNGEVAPDALKDRERKLLANRYPDRVKSGASCWFVMNMASLGSPRELVARSRKLLCRFGPAFRFNDQTLLNLLFYNSLDLFPWCSSVEVPALDTRRLGKYCRRHMDNQRWVHGKLTFMYRHFSPAEKERCISGRRNLKAAENDRHNLLSDKQVCLL